MNKLYMGIDVGTVSTKGVIIDEYDNIIASSYMDTLGNPIETVKLVVKEMKEMIDLNKYQVVSVGTTGSARKLIGTLLGASVIKNEIVAEATGTIKLYPDVRTILEIGGQDSKIILVNNGVVTDYAINSSCAAGTGSFISSLAERLNISIEDVASMAKKSDNMVNISNRCCIFAYADLLNKLQLGYKKEDILKGICHGVVMNYMNNVANGKKIIGPIVFNGGVSKNTAVVCEFEKNINEKIIVSKNSHLMGAIGIAMMARKSGITKIFDFNIDDYTLDTRVINCLECSNECEIVMVYRNNEFLDAWGNKCNNIGKLKKI